jgi:hypothetical protein
MIESWYLAGVSSGLMYERQPWFGTMIPSNSTEDWNRCKELSGLR